MMHWSLKVYPVSETPVLTAPDEPLLLYVHIPFCEELCPYCSFFKVVYDEELAAAYFETLKKEILGYSEKGFMFDEVYVGGGTPTVMPEHLGSVIELIRSLWNIREISVETNPNHLQPSILGALKNFGVTRLSVGVQTFNDELLRKLKRLEKYGNGHSIQKRLREAAGMFNTLICEGPILPGRIRLGNCSSHSPTNTVKLVNAFPGFLISGWMMQHCKNGDRHPGGRTPVDTHRHNDHPPRSLP